MRRTLAVILLTLSALVGLPGTAHAGGPTSVLITNPSTGQATALYYTSQEYADLERILTADPTKTTGLPAGSGSTQYTVTWLIHDVQPWRIDTVHLSASGAAFATTALVGSEGQVGEEVTQSKGRQIARGAELAALLDDVFADTSSATTPSATSEQAAVSAAPEPVAVEPAARWFSLTGWLWIVPGVLLGALVALVATRLTPRGRPSVAQLT